jgi:flavin-binding protein dodecin
MEAAHETEVVITATSPEGFEEAVAAGIFRATATLRGVQGVEIKDRQVLIAEGSIVGYKVSLAVTFVLEDGESESSGEDHLGVVVDSDEYRRLSEAAEELEDLRAYDEGVIELRNGEDTLTPWRSSRAKIKAERDELRRRGELWHLRYREGREGHSPAP